MTTVLFTCPRNEGRSQMAAAFFNQKADPEKAQASSAGLRPSERVHWMVVTAMRERGIELGKTRPLPLTRQQVSHTDLLITMGEMEPWVADYPHEEWAIENPKDQSLERVRAIRDEIEQKVEALLESRGWERDAAPDATATRDRDLS